MPPDGRSGAPTARRRVALNARQARERLGLTQESAAERVGCSVQALQRMERATAAVTIDFVARMATAYRIDLGELFVAAGPWRVPVVGRPPSNAVAGTTRPAALAAEGRGGSYAKSKRRAASKSRG